MNKHEQLQRQRMSERLNALGFSDAECQTLRRISMTLSRWGERECGDGSDWGLERDDQDWVVCSICGKKSYVEDCHAAGVKCHECKRSHCFINRYKSTGKPFLVYHGPGKPRRPIPTADREKGALTRLSRLMAGHPGCLAYHQPDCRGAAVYILTKEQLTGPVDSCYTNGIAVF